MHLEQFSNGRVTDQAITERLERERCENKYPVIANNLINLT